MSPRTVALHVLRALVLAQKNDTRPSLDGLTASLGIRRADVRSTLSRLHEQGYVDVVRMRPTLAGFALGGALAAADLPALRPQAAARSFAA